MDFHVEDNETCIIYTPGEKVPFEVVREMLKTARKAIFFQVNLTIYLYVGAMTINLRNGQRAEFTDDQEVMLVRRSYN